MMWHGYVRTDNFHSRACNLQRMKYVLQAMQNSFAKLKMHCMYVGAAVPPLQKRVTCVAITTALNITPKKVTMINEEHKIVIALWVCWRRMPPLKSEK